MLQAFFSEALFHISSRFSFLALFCFYSLETNCNMENRKENGAERRRRKVMSRPVLVRSERPGQVAASANYSMRPHTSSIWKEA